MDVLTVRLFSSVEAVKNVRLTTFGMGKAVLFVQLVASLIEMEHHASFVPKALSMTARREFAKFPINDNLIND